MLHLCCILSYPNKNLNIFYSKVLKFKSSARNSLGKLFHSFPAANLNVDWPVADVTLGKWISRVSLRDLPQRSDPKFILLWSCMGQQRLLTILNTGWRRIYRRLLDKVGSRNLSPILWVHTTRFVLKIILKALFNNRSKKSEFFVV